MTVRNGKACAIGAYRLYGDQWRIDAQFLKLRPWATLIGFDSMYRFERLSGRYRDVRDENSKTHVAYDLSAPSVIELADLAKAFSGMFSPVDVVYGSSTYFGIDPVSWYREPEILLPLESSRGCWWGQKHHCTFCGLLASAAA